jgi:methyl-accepting chemotaxis protein
MKDVKLGLFDRIAMSLTLREKFHILFWLPLVVIVLVFVLQERHVDSERQEEAILFQQQGLKQVSDLVSQIKDLSSITLPEGYALSDSGTIGTRISADEAQIISTIQTANNRYLTHTLQLSILEEDESHSMTLIICLLAVAIIALVNYVLGRFTYRTLYSLNKALHRLADGNLTERLNFVPSRDEFSSVARSIDRLADRQHQTMKLVSESTEALEMFADGFNEAASEGQSSARTQRQFLDSLATAMEEMSCAIRQVASNAHDTSEKTRLSNEEATKGAGSVSRTIDAIQALADEISQASTAVEQLTSRANRINEVVTVISSISNQTNLLALNAAIEAARAGEQGRGFAVVADEVRTLAGRTQQATVEIQSMLEELQSGTSSLNQIMDKTVLSAANSRELITGVGQDIESIASYSSAVFDMSTQIATSAEQQSAVASEISQNLEEVRQQSIRVEGSAADAVNGVQSLKITADELGQTLKGLQL